LWVFKKSDFPERECFAGQLEKNSFLNRLGRVYSVDGTLMDTSSDFHTFHKGRSASGPQLADSYILENGKNIGLMGETHYRWVWDAFRNAGTTSSPKYWGREAAGEVMGLMCVDTATLNEQQRSFTQVVKYLCNDVSDLDKFPLIGIQNSRKATIKKLPPGSTACYTLTV
jgi:hypothetical protein